MSLGDLLEKTRTTMPSDRPGSLPASAYADILAFIAQQNGYPAGAKELADNPGALKNVRITAKPGSRP
jgi:quinoprotein glucose dehydrogenase